MVDAELELEFDNEMMGLYTRAKKETGYNATRFIQMLNEHRGLQTARILIHAETVSDGYTKLWELRRLDLAVEALVIKPRYKSLFTEGERAIALKRLSDYEYVPKDG